MGRTSVQCDVSVEFFVSVLLTTLDAVLPLSCCLFILIIYLYIHLFANACRLGFRRV